MPAPPPDRPGDTINCEDLRNKIGDRRCDLYEALPSVLLAMNALPGYDDRLSAMRDANGGWALIEGSSGEWKAASATEPNVAYDLRHYGVRAGVELASGEAKVDSAGEIELSGSGAGRQRHLLRGRLLCRRAGGGDLVRRRNRLAAHRVGEQRRRRELCDRP